MSEKGWDRFWNWYKSHLKENLLFLLIIHVLQFPHMYWAADVYLQTNTISHIHPILDFLLYGVDLLEILSFVAIVTTIYAHGFHGEKK